MWSLTDELEKAMKQYTNAGGKEKPVRDISAVLEKWWNISRSFVGNLPHRLTDKQLILPKCCKSANRPRLAQCDLTSANHILALDRIQPPDNTAKDKPTQKRLFAISAGEKGYALCGALSS